ncbi:MAG: hypothetical protein A2X66_09345 [Ignavibacteria bacterium GWA2_54_16]|nr:MAG: hypothetical protein A2X66_09345 [Ignavibacteria bacterium GWA2_54_16]
MFGHFIYSYPGDFLLVRNVFENFQFFRRFRNRFGAVTVLTHLQRGYCSAGHVLRVDVAVGTLHSGILDMHPVVVGNWLNNAPPGIEPHNDEKNDEDRSNR